ncbi:bacillolysin [Bacillus anthracis]|nr:bacillolysin [Bacillus anthracis]
MNYRKLAYAFVTFGLLCPLSAKAIYTQEFDKNEVKVEISQPSLTIGKLTQPQNDTKEILRKSI